MRGQWILYLVLAVGYVHLYLSSFSFVGQERFSFPVTVE